MTIDIQNPEVEAALARHLQSGGFSSLEAMLLDVLQKVPHESSDLEIRRAKALAAAERMRNLQKEFTLDRPEGMTLREYAHLGHKY